MWVTPTPSSSFGPQTALQDQTPPAAGAARGAALCSPPGPRPHTPHSAGQPLTEPTAPHHLGTPRLPPPALDPHHPQPPPGAGAAPEGPFVQDTNTEVTHSNHLPRAWGCTAGTHPIPGHCRDPQGATREPPKGSSTEQGHSPQCSPGTITSQKHSARRWLIRGSFQACGGPHHCSTPSPQPHQDLCPQSAAGCPQSSTEQEKPQGREPESPWM